MPREFQDFSQEVSQGTDKIKNSLDAVRDAADQADVSSGKLSKTQDSSTRVADSYAKSMAGVAVAGRDVARGLSAADSSIKTIGSSLSSIKSGAGDAVSGLSEVRDVSQQVADALQDITGRKVGIEFDASSAMAARDVLDSIDEQLDTMDGRTASMQVSADCSEAADCKKELSGVQAEMKKTRQEAEKKINVPPLPLTEGLQLLNKQIKSTQKEIQAIEDSAGRLSKVEKVEFVGKTVGLAQMRELMEALDTDVFTDVQRQLIGLKLQAGDLEGALEYATDASDDFAASLGRAGNEAMQTATASRKYTGEIDKASNLTELATKKMQEGEKQAEDFADGLGKNGGAMMAAGVAAFFLLQKVADLIDQFKDARMELATFRVDLAALEKQAEGLGFEGTFAGLRNDLNLTRSQSSEFFKVLKEGAQSGVVSVGELQSAAQKLQATFGGDPTERLREYVELLREIPTLKTDLSITASLDDQAAALFGLAESGKIDAAIELEMAGLLGGPGGLELDTEDVELLNAQQKTEKGVQDVHDFLSTTLFPSVAPQISAIASGTTRMVAGLGAVVVGLGFLKALFAKQVVAQGVQVVAQKATTAAVLTRGATDTATKLASSGVQAGATAAGTAGAGGLAAGGGGAAAGGAAAALGPVAIAAAVAALAAAAVWGGEKLQDMGDDAAKSGKRLQGGMKQVLGAQLQIAGLGVLLGPAGWIAGFAINMEELGSGLENIGETAMMNADGMGELGTAAYFAGNVMDDLGEALQKAEGILWDTLDNAKEIVKKGFDNALKNVKRGYKVVSDAAAVAGTKLKVGLQVLGVNTDELKEKFKQLAANTPVLREFVELAKASGQYIENIKKRQKQDAELGEKFDVLKKNAEETAKVLREDRMRTLRSGLALQRQLGAIKSEFESSALALGKLRVAVASARLDQLSEVGSTAARFDAAISDSSDAVMSRFGELAEASARSRMRIIKDSKLNSKARSAALMELNRRELEATEEFVKGMEMVIDALFKTPQILIAGFERELAGAEIDIEIAGGGGEGRLGELIAEQNKAAIDALNRTTEARKKAQVEIARLEKAQLKQAEQFRKSFVNELNNLGQQTDEATKKALTDIRKRFTESGAGKMVDGAFEFTDMEKAAESIDKTRKAMADAEGEIEKFRKQLKPDSFANLALDLRKFANKEKAAEEAAKKAAEQKRDAGTDKEREEAAKAELKASAEAEQAAKDALAVKKKILGLIEATGKLSGKEEQVQKALVMAAEAFATGQKPLVKNLTKAGVEFDVAKTVLDKLAQLSDDQSKKVGEQLRGAVATANAESKTLAAQQGLVAITNGKAKAAEKQAEAAKKEAEAAERVRQIVLESIDNQLDAIGKTDAFINAARAGELSETLGELASFTEDFAGVIAQGTKLAIKASRDRAVLERRAIERGFQQSKAAIEAQLGAGRITKQQAQSKLEGAALKRRNELAKAEVRQKKAVVDAAAREASLKNEALDVDEQVIQAQMDFLSDVGGSFSQINRLQQASVAIERQRLAVIEEEAAVARANLGDSLETRKKEAAVEIQKLKLRKAEFGIQKDIYEKLLGKAFGEMRSDIGAARRRGSDVGLLGRQKTRVALRSGLLAGSGGGRVMTIDERAAQRALGGLSDLGGQLTKAGGPLGGKGPERMSVEEEIANAGKTTAESTKELAEAGTTRGSLFTHDFNVVSILKEIAGKMGIMVSATEDVEDAVKDGGKKTEAGVAANKAGAAKQQEQSKTVMEQLTMAKKSFREQLTMARLLSQDKDSSREAAEATEAAKTELGKIRQLEANIRSREIMSPIAGGTVPTPEMQRILSGKPSPEEKAFQQHQLESATKAAKATETTATEVKKTRAKAEAPERPGFITAETRAFFARERGERMDAAFVDKQKEEADERAKFMKEMRVKYGPGLTEEEMAAEEARKTNRKLDEIGKEEVKTREQEAQNVKDATKTTRAEVEAAKGPESNRAAVREVSDRMSPEQQQRAQRSTMEDVAGLGTPGTPEAASASLRQTVDRSEASALRVMGQINVVLNTKLFRAEMATLVAEVINTEQVRSALDKRYLTEAK